MNAVLLFLLVASSGTNGQTGGATQGGTIQGTVRDVSGAPIAGAAVEAKNAQTRMAYSALSASSGSYSVTKLPPGQYAVTVTKPGMQVYSHAFLTVQDGKAIREDVDLEVDRNPAAAVTEAAPVVVLPVSRAELRDFYAEDAQFDLTSPMLVVNDRGVELPRNAGLVKGGFLWVYLPGHGRYVLSLAPHADLGFQAAGEVGGTTLKFRVGSDEIEIDSNDRILMGSASYNLYVLNQAAWAPKQAGERSAALIGAIDRVDSLPK